MEIGSIPLVKSVDTDHLRVTAGKLDFSANQDTALHRWQGSFLEQFDFTISVSNGTVTGSLEKEGGGDLTEFFSDEFTTLSTPATVDLTSLVGTDTDPEAAFVYILQSDKPTLVAAATWPAASVEHIRVASVILQSAATTGTEKALMNRNWNDMSFGVTNPRGHGLHLGERLRFEHALWNSGVVLLITGSGTGTVTLDTSAGTVYQLHLHVFPAIDMAGADNIHLVNLSGSEYSTTVNLVAGITTLANGSTSLANNKYFNLVVWGVQNRSGETSHLMCNLPTGQYTKSADATVDSRKFSVHTIPPAFRGTGFLIAELTFQFVSGPTWTLVQNKDLLGQTPTLVPGGGTTTSITTFSDSSFEVFDNGDDSKRLALQLSGLTIGANRTLTIPDTDSTILTSDGKTALDGAWNMGNQNLTDVNVNSGTIDGTTIGGATPAAGDFTTVALGGATLARGILALEGADASIGNVMEFFTDADAHPLLQLFPYSHDNVSIGFDVYFDGTNAKSSDVGSNFQLRKRQDLFELRYDSGISAGSVVTWNDGWDLDTTGRFTVRTGDLFVSAGNLQVTTGDITITSGNLSVIDGDCTIKNNLTVQSGNLLVTTGNLTVTAGDLIVSAGNLQVKDNINVVSGVYLAGGSAGVTGDIVVVTGVDFGAESVTTKTIIYSKGIITGVK